MRNADVLLTHLRANINLMKGLYATFRRETMMPVTRLWERMNRCVV